MENGNTLSLAQFAIDQSAVPVLWIDAAGKIIYANHTAGNFFNQLNHYLTDSNIKEVLHDEYTDESWAIQWEQVKKCKYFRRSIATRLYNSWFAEMHFISAKDSDFIELRMIANESNFRDERLGERENNPYAVIFNNSFHFMARLTSEGRILEINQTGLTFLGAKNADVLGYKLTELKNFDNFTNSRMLLEEGLKQVSCEQFVRFELTIKSAADVDAVIDFSAKTVLNDVGEIEFLLAEARDITGYKEIEKALVKNANQYRKLAQDIPNTAIIQYNKSLDILLAEGQALEKITSNKTQLEGDNIKEVLPVQQLQNLLVYFNKSLNGTNSTLEYDLNGIDFLLIFNPVYDEKKEIEGGILLLFDISKLKATENLLNKKLHELEKLNEKLSKEVSIRREIEKNLKDYSEELKIKNNELEQFAYVASHDLQEPLRMISSFTQLLGQKYQDKLDADANEFIKYTLDGTTRMQRLINDLLIYSRVGRKGAGFEHVPLKEIIELAKQNLQLVLEETDTEIIYNDLPAVYADKGQLIQLLQNLISNAIKFRKEHEVPRIEITATEHADVWEITVKDNGIGFDMKHKERIFNIFQRLHSQGEYSGTGIGLAICKKIAERHGGEIWAESEPLKGSAFHFTVRKP